MANKGYRTRAAGPLDWSNPLGTTWEVYNGGVYDPTTNTWTPGTWTTALVGDYPTSADLVWIQSTHIVTYDATAIGAIGTGVILRQISRQTAAHASYAGTSAQPTGGTAGSNATTGYIAISVTGTQYLRSNYYIIGTGLSGTTGMFTISASSISFNIGATSGVSSFCEGTGSNAKLIHVVTALTGTSVNMISSTDIKQGGSTENISLNSNTTLTITCPNVDLTTSSNHYIFSAGASTITLNGNTNGSNSAYVSNFVLTTAAPTIIINGSVNAGSAGPCINIGSSTTNYVQVSGDVRNYGLVGGTPTNQYNAIIGTHIRMTSTGSHIYYNIGGEADFRVGSSTSSAAQVWDYFQNNTGSLSRITRLHNVSTLESTGDQIATLNT